VGQARVEDAAEDRPLAGQRAVARGGHVLRAPPGPHAVHGPAGRLLSLAALGRPALGGARVRCRHGACDSISARSRSLNVATGRSRSPSPPRGLAPPVWGVTSSAAT